MARGRVANDQHLFISVDSWRAVILGMDYSLGILADEAFESFYVRDLVLVSTIEATGGSYEKKWTYVRNRVVSVGQNDGIECLLPPCIDMPGRVVFPQCQLPLFRLMV